MKVSKGLYEVITSDRLSLEQKLEAIPRFALPTHHLDGEYDGMTEPGEITAEDATLICDSLHNGELIKLDTE